MKSHKFGIGSLFLAAVLIVASFIVYFEDATNYAQGALPVAGATSVSADGSGVTTHRFIKFASAGVISTAALASDDIVGVCEQTATANQITKYAPPGTMTTLDSGAAIAAGNKLTCLGDGTGKATPVSNATASPTTVGAIALSSDATGTGTVLAIVVPSVLGSPASYAGSVAVGTSLTVGTTCGISTNATVGGTLTTTGAVTNNSTTALNGSATLGTNNKLLFRESTEYVYSDAANSLTIAAGTRIKTSLPIFSASQTFVTIAGPTLSLNVNDSGKVFNVTGTAVITLPATSSGVSYTFFCDGAAGTVQISIAPAAADGISGLGTTGTVNKALINTLSTANRGDLLTISGSGTTGATGWLIVRQVGTWAWAS